MRLALLALCALLVGCQTPILGHTYQGVSLSTEITTGQSDGDSVLSLSTLDRDYRRTTTTGAGVHESSFWAVTLGAQWHFGYKITPAPRPYRQPIPEK